MQRRRNAPTLARLGLIGLLAAGGALLAPPAAAQDGSCPIPSAQSGEPAAPTADSNLDQKIWAEEATQALPPGYRLDPARVAPILDEIRQPQPELSAWERLMRRLEAWLLRAGDDATAPQWLVKLLNDIPAWWWKATLYTLLGTLVLALAVLIYVELRAAGAFRRRRAQPAAAGATATAAALRNAPELADIAALPLREQPAALLQWAIRRLVARDVVPPDRSLTNGELLALVTVRAPDELPTLRRLTRAAEAVVYGAQAPAAEETRALMELVAPPRAPEAAA